MFSVATSAIKLSSMTYGTGIQTEKAVWKSAAKIAKDQSHYWKWILLANKSMKLYGTITSERATKGQGGNKHLDIRVLDDNRAMIATLRIEPFTDKVRDGIRAEINFAEHVYVNGKLWLDTEIIDDHAKYRASEDRMIEAGKQKGEKQKGKTLRRTCSNCGDERRMLADMIGEDGEMISFCEDCLDESE